MALIAGMGGRTIGRILAASPEVVASLRALVLHYRVGAANQIEQRSRRYSAFLVVPPYSTAR